MENKPEVFATAKEVLESAQLIANLAQLVTFVGRAEKFKEKMGQPIIAQVMLVDPQKTAAAINSELILEAVKQRCRALIVELNEQGVNTQDMLVEIEAEIEKQFNQMQ